MEVIGDNFVAMVENLQGTGLAVTMVNKPRTGLSLDRRTLPPSMSPNSQKSHVVSTVQTEKEKTPTINSGIQSCDDRFVSSYQVAHCKLAPTSPPLAPTEFPRLLSRTNKKTVRLTHDAHSFVESLRKYPQNLTQVTRSSELIEKVLSASLSKRMIKERAKRAHSALRSRLTKCMDGNTNKVIQTYTRCKKEKKSTGSDGNHNASTITAKPNLSPTPLDEGLRDVSPRVQRMGRVAEVRYLNDVRKCIRDAFRHVCDNDANVCQNIQRRMSIHQRRHHSTCSKDVCCETDRVSLDDRSASSRELGSQIVPQKSLNRQGSKICCICLETLPCTCRKEAKEKTAIHEDSECIKFRNENIKDLFSSKSCCKCIIEEREYDTNVLKQAFDWMQEIPVNANFTCEDKIKRQVVMRKLVNFLLEFRGMQDKQREEIKKCLDELPMWRPVDQFDHDIFINKLIENLLTRINGLSSSNDNLTDIVSRWINGTLLNHITDNDIMNMEQLLNNLLFIIKSLKVDEVQDEYYFKQLLMTHLKNVLKEIPMKRTSDMNFLDKAANKLVETITNTLYLNVSPLKNISRKGNSETTIEQQNFSRPSNYNEDLCSSVPQSVIEKNNQPNIIEGRITPSSNLNHISQHHPTNDQNTTCDVERHYTYEQYKLNKKQNLREYLENKVLDVLEKLPMSINYDTKQTLKNEISNMISRKLNLAQYPFIKHEALENGFQKDRTYNQSVPLTKLPLQHESIRDLVKEQVARLLDKYAINNKYKTTVKNDMTNLLTDQIMRNDNDTSVKGIACSILEGLNIPENEVEDLYNSILQHTNKTSLIQNKTSVFSGDSTSKYQEKTDILKKTEKEIFNFLDEITKKNDMELKQKLITPTKLLAEEIEKIISSSERSAEDKENMITKKVFNFLRNKLFPTAEMCHTFAKHLAKRILQIPLQSSTPKAYDDYVSIQREPTLSVIYHDNEYFNEIDQTSLNGINQNPNVHRISDEVLKWIENIPSEYIISPDKRLHKMLAKEIAKKVQASPISLDSHFDSFLEREILRWLPKIAKHSNQAELHWMAENLKETIKQKLISDDDEINENSNSSLIFNEVLKWIENIPSEYIITPDKRFHTMLAKEIVRKVQTALASSSSHFDSFLEREILQLLPKIVKDSNESELRWMAEDLKQIIRQKLRIYDGEIKESSNLYPIYNEVLRWFESIPSEYIISPHKRFHKMLAKDIARKVQAPPTSPTLHSDSFLKLEILQWLSKIAIHSNEAELRRMADDLKEKIKQKLTPDIVSLSKFSDESNVIENLKDNLRGWLKNTQMYQKRNTLEKLYQENLVSDLARELNDIIYNNISNESLDYEDELILKTIETRIKQFPMDPRVKYNDKYHRKIAFEILNHLKNLGLSRKSSTRETKLKRAISRWLKNLPLKWEPDYQYLSDKLNSLLSEFLKNKNVHPEIETYLKSEVINVLQDLPLNEDYHSYDTLQILVDNLLKKLHYELKHKTHQRYFPDTAIRSKEPLHKQAALSHDRIPITNTYSENGASKKTNSSNRPDNLDNIYEGVGSLHVRADPNQTTFADKATTSNNFIGADKIYQEVPMHYEKIPINFGGSGANKKKVEEIKQKLTSGLINILDRLNSNSSLAAETDDENVLKNEIDRLLQTLSENDKYKEYLLSLKKDLLNITKEISRIRKKTLAKQAFKNELHKVADKTLPTTSNLLYKHTSFEDMKEKLIDAFINLNEITNDNTSKYKEKLRKEINKFCNEYIQRHPAARADADQLCQDLYTALKNVSYPDNKSISSQINLHDTKDKIERTSFELPLQGNETNETLKNFVKHLVNYLQDQETEPNLFFEKDKNLEKRFSLKSVQTANTSENTKDLFNRLKKYYEEGKHKSGRYQKAADAKELQSKTPATCLTEASADAQKIPRHLKYQAQTLQKADDVNQRHSDNQTETMPEFEITVHDSEEILPNKRRYLTDHGQSFTRKAPCNAIQRPDQVNSKKRYTERSQDNRSPTQNEVSPHIIVKEYYWGSTASHQASDLQPEVQSAQNQLRRTVPSLPLTHSNIPYSSYPMQRIHSGSVHRTNPREPYGSHISGPGSNFPPMPELINQQSLEDVPRSSGMPPSITRNKYGHSYHNLSPMTTGETEPTRTQQHRQGRRKFCTDQFTTCSNSGLHGANRFSGHFRYSDEGSEFRNNSRYCEGGVRTDLDLERALVDDGDGKRESKDVGVNKHRPKEIEDRLTAISNSLTCNRQRANNLAQCKKCRGTICPHPSHFYFS